MAKKYDMLQTSKMSAEYDGSLIIGDCVAQTDLENGRLAVVDEVNKTVSYAIDETKEVVLVAGVEKLYNDEGLTEYINPKDDMVRVLRMPQGDKFITTAFTGLIKGDKAVAGADGKFVKCTDESTAVKVFEVLEVTTLYFDRTPAIKVKVVK